MSFVLSFTPSGLTATLYEECIKKLEDAGAGSPKGRSYHICHGDPKSIQVTEVWDSMEDFQAFGETLLPILKEVGVDPGQPTPLQVHNIIVG